MTSGLSWLGIVPLWLWAQPAPPVEDYKDRLPRIAPVEPAAALETFTVPPGFQLEQAATEPLVVDPVALSFDERGRMFVVEMRDYSEQDRERLGRIRMLEDLDNDGRFDRASVYVEGLSWPTAVLCYDGGVFVGAPPDLYYCKDIDGDGKAEHKELVFTGFGRSNVQGLMNCFRWGLDNRIYAAVSSTGAEVRRPDRPDLPAVSLRGRDFSFDPRTRELRPESGGGQHGMCFDDWGRKFVSSNSNHIQLLYYEDRYLARNPYLVAPSPNVSISAEGPACEVFRTSPVEPWRIVRTELRISGKVPGIVEGGGRAAGYFTGATGVTIYRGDAWPAEYLGQAFVGDVGSNLVHRKTLSVDGIGLLAHRADQGHDFLTSRDLWFRPAQFENGPDGNLYILDVYREVIEHPASIPPILKQHLDLTSGRDRGRIYRLTPNGFVRRPAPRWDQASTDELVVALGSSNGWTRDTAARLLAQQRDPASVAPLRKMLADSTNPRGRLHALYALQTLGQLEAADLLARLSDPEPRIREHAARLSEGFVKNSPEIMDSLISLANDPDARVRYQTAFSLGEVPGAAATAALARLAEKNASDRWFRLAILSSVHNRRGELVTALTHDPAFGRTSDGLSLLATLAEQIGRQGARAETTSLLKFLESLTEPADQKLAQALAKGVSEGLAKSTSPARQELLKLASGKAGALLREWLAQSRLEAVDEKLAPAQRAEAVRTLSLAPAAEHRGLWQDLLQSRQPQEVQLAAVATLGRSREPLVSELLLAAWGGFSPRVRGEAAEVMFARPERQSALLDGIAAGQVRPTDLEPARIKQLLQHPDSAFRRRAEQLLAQAGLNRRADVVASYQTVLQTKGEAERGRVVFRKVCAACHKLEGVGQELGLNLATIRNKGAEAILLNVLDPNREVNPQYVNYLVITTDGRTLTGLIAAETATSITLKRAEGATDTVLRSDIETLQSTGLSLMPEGLERQVSPADMADLVSYFLSLP